MESHDESSVLTLKEFERIMRLAQRYQHHTMMKCENGVIRSATIYEINPWVFDWYRTEPQRTFLHMERGTE